jgi:hypothetical protein
MAEQNAVIIRKGYENFALRVLPAPPRSLTQTEISRLGANSPELAGIHARILSL